MSTWKESEASNFKVRGPNYLDDNVKIRSKESKFKLLAIDLFEVSETTQNTASNPKNRVHLATQRGDNSFIFVINIMVPGPPHLSFVMYFLVDLVCDILCFEITSVVTISFLGCYNCRHSIWQTSNSFLFRR